MLQVAAAVLLRLRNMENLILHKGRARKNQARKENALKTGDRGEGRETDHVGVGHETVDEDRDGQQAERQGGQQPQRRGNGGRSQGHGAE